MIVFGGRDIGGGNLNDLWVLTNANGLGGKGEWINLIPNGTAGSPPARSGHSTVYDSTNNRVIIFGGCSASCAPVLNDVWVLTNGNGLGGTPAWTQLQLSGGPAPRTNSAVGYDPAQNELIVFGGQDGSANPCSTFSDTWLLSKANGLGGASAWMNVPGFGPPPSGQNGAVAAYSSGALYLFGGLGMVNGTCTATNDLWEIGGPDFLATGQFTAGGASPPARALASLSLDSVSGRILMFGGTDAFGNYLNDVWSLSDEWTQITPKNTPPQPGAGKRRFWIRPTNA